VRDIPTIANIICDKEELQIPFVRMPRDTQVLNFAHDALITIIKVGVVTIAKIRIINREAEHFQIVFIFADWCDDFLGPDINHSITNHPRVATQTCQSKRMAVFDVEFTWVTLDDQPRFVIGKDWQYFLFLQVFRQNLPESGNSGGIYRNQPEFQNSGGIHWNLQESTGIATILLYKV
jgi:hypothetical protein